MMDEEIKSLQNALRRMERNSTYVNTSEQRRADSLAVFAVCAAILTPRIANVLDKVISLDE